MIHEAKAHQFQIPGLHPFISFTTICLIFSEFDTDIIHFARDSHIEHYTACSLCQGETLFSVL
jgi:hypothetical protein